MSNAVVMEVVAGAVVGAGAAALVMIVGSAGVQRLLPRPQDVVMAAPQAEQSQPVSQTGCGVAGNAAAGKVGPRTRTAAIDLPATHD